MPAWLLFLIGVFVGWMIVPAITGALTARKA